MAKLGTIGIPAGFFGIVLGLSGLAGGWRIAAKIWNVTPAIGEAISLLAAVIWLVLALMYAAKWIWLRSEALAEFNHPVLCCFAASTEQALFGRAGEIPQRQRPSFIFRPLRAAS